MCQRNDSIESSNDKDEDDESLLESQVITNDDEIEAGNDDVDFSDENLEDILKDSGLEERAPLLGKKSTVEIIMNAGGSQFISVRITDYIKALLAFTISMSFSFVQQCRPLVGEFGYLASVAILFFHPSKSVGAMFEAVVYGLVGVIMGSIVSLVSLYFSYRMGNPSEFWGSFCLLVLVLFSFVFVIAYIRARSSRPPVYTGTVIAQTVFFISVMSNHQVNLGLWNTDKLVKVIVSILLGILVGFLTNILFWPRSASFELRKDLVCCLRSLNNILDKFVFSFLSDEIQNFDFDELLARHRYLVGRLNHIHEEAKVEFFSHFLYSKTQVYRSITSSISRLTQHVGGMKSCLLKEEKLLSGSRNAKFLKSFLESIGPNVKQLSSACKDTIQEVTKIASLPPPGLFNKSFDEDAIKFRIHKLQESVALALHEFEFSQKKTLEYLIENERFDDSPNDELFMVYFFVFNLLEFAKEIQLGLLKSLQRTRSPLIQWKDSVERSPNNQNISSFKAKNSHADYKYFEYLQSQTNDNYHNYLRSPSSLLNYAPKKRKNNVDLERNSDVRGPITDFIPESALLKYRLMIWRVLSDIGRSFELKFALKSALVVTGIGVTAFLPQTMIFFSEYRVNWCLISIIVIMTPTVGGTNLSGILRLFGTFCGVAYSYIIMEFFGRNTLISWLMLSLFAIPAFYLMLYSNFPRVGQVALVSVASITLAYFSSTSMINLFELAWKQGLMVSSGIIIGLLVTWYIWPYEARVELRKGLSDLLLNMGILYSRLVEVFNSSASATKNRESLITEENFLRKNAKITPETIHRYYYADFEDLSKIDTLSYFLSFELKVNMELMKLESLLPLTWLEPRLKGPFPIDIYSQMLSCCQNILDKFVAMRVAISNNVYLSEEAGDIEQIGNLRGSTVYFGKEDLVLGLAPTYSSESVGDNQYLHKNQELLPYRRDLIGSVLLSFYIFAGSLILKQPLPTYLPQAREARMRLMRRIQDIIHSSKQSATSSESRRQITLVNSPKKYINYYAYSLAMEDVILELERLGYLLKCLFGEMFADILSMQDDNNSQGGYEETISSGVNADSKQNAGHETNFLPGSPMLIPLLHHNRADKWGSLREKAIQNIPNSSNIGRISIIDPSSWNSVEEVKNKEGQSSSGKPNDSLWRISGNWML